MSKKTVAKKAAGKRVPTGSALKTAETLNSVLRAPTPGGLPPGTETEAWRLMSAKIAHAFWTNALRLQQPSQIGDQAETWEQAATNYRILIRSTLRTAEREAICFRPHGDALTLDQQSDEWRIKTARLAWLLWLETNRRTNRIPNDQQLDVWKAESPEFRAYVRSVVKTVSDIGFEIV